MLASLFFIERRMGRWGDAMAHYREALERDPRNVSLRAQGACEILFWLRRFDEMRAQLNEVLKIAPDDTTSRACLAQVEQRLGRLDAADVWLERVPKDSGDYYENLAHIDQARFRRDLAALTALTESATRRSDSEFTNVLRVGVQYALTVLVPYFAFSRAITSAADVRKVFLAFIIAALPIALLSVFEVVKNWHIYGSIQLAWDGPIIYLLRAGLLRDSVTSSNSIVLGFILMVAFGCVLAVWKKAKPRFRWIVLVSIADSSALV